MHSFPFPFFTNCYWIVVSLSSDFDRLLRQSKGPSWKVFLKVMLRRRRDRLLRQSKGPSWKVFLKVMLRRRRF